MIPLALPSATIVTKSVVSSLEKYGKPKPLAPPPSRPPKKNLLIKCFSFNPQLRKDLYYTRAPDPSNNQITMYQTRKTQSHKYTQEPKFPRDTRRRSVQRSRDPCPSEYAGVGVHPFLINSGGRRLERECRGRSPCPMPVASLLARLLAETSRHHLQRRHSRVRSTPSAPTSPKVVATFSSFHPPSRDSQQCSPAPAR